MIEFKDIAKIYPGNQVACEDVNIKIEDGEFVCFIGTSGSGKTTCMRMINRMTEPTHGSILIDNKDIKKENPVELRKKIGYVIQQIGLMPHMTIFDNIVMVPRLLKWDETKLRPIAENLIERVDLPKEYLDRYPSELSGGQQQRIGVIRALAADQDIILMDEPFGALDPITRNSLQQLIKALQKEMGKTVIFVTHDMDEALQLSDKIVIMDKGHVIQIGSPENILKNPATNYVRELLGEEKLNEAKTSYNTVETIMLKNPVHANLRTTTLDAIRLMRSRRVDTLFITDDNGVLLGHVGIFDLVRIGRKNVPLKTVLERSHPILNTTKVIEAIHQIYKLKVKNLPVVDSKKRLVGIVTRASIVDTIYENLWSEDETIEEIIDTSSSEELKKLTEEAQVNLND
ncbi:osmoprotectant transport system ATP-binding protein [Peptoniphilus asaccharolyticus DSM 20463]|uniref:Quaternary amine transport ATP-binding protein n=1 Tax=Peptoniphilus asaccharolyticus DSM 20463 TaxID=573058 RepID=A0A1W1VKQ2_PEPAS|nr:ABC transporter ATP-binding protein [Peptoniphilus asaccharolyticus]MBL7574427.1 ABC transporter ATP-binding protein [Peptoniphilus asaccharolyticus]SMB93641.1 osmoprotectant transport system ATP-binding protein [Peptoniphilus asaccharolyticus DSM 20463]